MRRGSCPTRRPAVMLFVRWRCGAMRASRRAARDVTTSFGNARYRCTPTVRCDKDSRSPVSLLDRPRRSHFDDLRLLRVSVVRCPARGCERRRSPAALSSVSQRVTHGVAPSWWNRARAHPAEVLSGGDLAGWPIDSAFRRAMRAPVIHTRGERCRHHLAPNRESGWPSATPMVVVSSLRRPRRA